MRIWKVSFIFSILKTQETDSWRWRPSSGKYQSHRVCAGAFHHLVDCKEQHYTPGVWVYRLHSFFPVRVIPGSVMSLRNYYSRKMSIKWLLFQSLQVKQNNDNNNKGVAYNDGNRMSRSDDINNSQRWRPKTKSPQFSGGLGQELEGLSNWIFLMPSPISISMISMFITW